MRTTYFALLTLLMGLIITSIGNADPVSYQVIPLNSGSRPFRILPDNSSQGFWIVDYGNGLIYAAEENGQWNIQYYSIQGAYEATGPDSSGRLFITARRNPPQLLIFDTQSRTVVDSFDFDTYLAGLTLSPDESMVYLCAWTKPALGDYIDSEDNKRFPDSGRIYEFDLASRSITRTAVVGASPETVFRTQNNTLLVSTNASQDITVPGNNGWDWIVGAEEYVDIVDLNRFERIDRFTCNETPTEFTNNFVPWSNDGRYIAMCVPEVCEEQTRPGFENGIWIIDTQTDSVSQTIPVIGPDSCEMGAKNMRRSSLNSSIFYVCTSILCSPYDYKLLSIDASTGQLVQGISVPYNFAAEDVAELPDGRLFVSTGYLGQLVVVTP